MRARVTHEDAGGVEVEQQEARAGAREGGCQLDVRDLPQAGRGEHQRHGHYEDDAGGQSVHPIQQVDGVLHAEQPEQGDRNGQQAERHELGARQPKRCDLESEDEDRK